MSPEQFEARARERLRVKGESPSAGHDLRILTAAREASAEIRAERRARRRRWWMPVAVAATVGVLAVGLWSAVDQGSSRDVTTRGVARERILPTNGATLERTPLTLTWSGQPGASSYQVTLRAVDATVIWRSEPTPGTEAAIPAGLPVAPGATYLWSIDYTGPATSGSMGPYSFRIADSTR